MFSLGRDGGRAVDACQWQSLVSLVCGELDAQEFSVNEETERNDDDAAV